VVDDARIGSNQHIDTLSQAGGVQEGMEHVETIVDHRDRSAETNGPKILHEVRCRGRTQGADLGA
jgi:hypothetical protein